MNKRLTDYKIFKDILRNDCVKAKASLDLTEEQIETALGETKENVFEIVGDVPID